MLYDTKYRLDKNKKCRIKNKKETFYETSLHFAVPNGLEPSTSCVTGRHVFPYITLNDNGLHNQHFEICQLFVNNCNKKAGASLPADQILKKDVMKHDNANIQLL